MSDPERNEAAQAEESGGNAPGENFDLDSLRNILEGVLLAAARPLSLDQLQTLLGGEEGPDKGTLRRALQSLEEDCAHRGVELVEVASGFRLQVRQELQPWVTKLWEERPPRYSRALLETLALIAYRQPITRGEIEDVRGVSVSTNIIRQLEEREWIRVVGHRDVPGKPALFGTTKAFLDYFGLKSLDDLPSLAELRDIESLEPELDFSGGSQSAGSAESEGGGDAAADEAEAMARQAESAEATETADEPEVREDSAAQEAPGEDAAASGEASGDERPEPAGEDPEMDAHTAPADDEPDVEAGPAGDETAEPADEPVKAGAADPDAFDPDLPDAGDESDLDAEAGEPEEARRGESPPDGDESPSDDESSDEAASAGRR